MRSVLASIVLAVMLTGAAVAGPFEDGVAAFRSGDYVTAARIFRPLAEQGNSRAQNNLGLMYDEGQGVLQDDAEAVKWYRVAAEQGNASAQLNLGLMYAEGQGVPQDYVQAHMWASLAAANGNDTAAMVIDITAAQMTPGQIAEAQKLAREWKPK